MAGNLGKPLSEGRQDVPSRVPHGPPLLWNSVSLVAYTPAAAAMGAESGLWVTSVLGAPARLPQRLLSGTELACRQAGLS